MSNPMITTAGAPSNLFYHQHLPDPWMTTNPESHTNTPPQARSHLDYAMTGSMDHEMADGDQEMDSEDEGTEHSLPLAGNFEFDKQ